MGYIVDEGPVNYCYSVIILLLYNPSTIVKFISETSKKYCLPIGEMLFNYR